MPNKIIVVALGGHALILDGDQRTVTDQYKAVEKAAKQLIEIVNDGWKLLITHGNGPQIGYILRRSEMALEELHPVPMDYAGADTQGAIGYMLQRAMNNEFSRRSMNKTVFSMITQVVVSVNDNAFSDPTKPIGSFMDKNTAELMESKYGWVTKEYSTNGWRRVVPSPIPNRVVESSLIKSAMDYSDVVICCGGGGIPVVIEKDGMLKGVEAVIDKDYTSSLIASVVEADVFAITTDVPNVAINYGTEREELLHEIDSGSLRQLYDSGEFPDGSMGPKVKAGINFVNEADGRKSIITNAKLLRRGVEGRAGTIITRTKGN
ncbi:MAG TPA: carbamate kinase [Chloroflexi bacterium]|nr:carbamate kinase [Chloroflexota bacterium]|tara:strand:+ start:1227 stop:2186 length:960 start_codon:yes stop_codon:yes gene_type:complete